MSDWEGLIRVILPTACFGLVVKHGIVYESAPYGRRDSLGKSADVVCRHWKGKGARLEVIPYAVSVRHGANVPYGRTAEAIRQDR